jgi:D-arabinose 1-dehydrogenase-like Zn-dependent alcohol dehydrogenase
VPRMPARRFSQLPESEGFGHQLRRRIPAVHAGAGRGAGGDTRKSERRRGGASTLRRNYNLWGKKKKARIPPASPPLLCAGITTYNALRHSGAMPGDLVAVLGIGGLGHLGIQYANKFGYKVVAIGRGPESAALAKKLGASVYIDNKSTNAAEELKKLGGAQVILATAPSSKSMSELIDGLGPNGKLIVIGATFDPIEVTPIQLITGSKTIQGWAAGTPADSEDTLRFSELTGVRAMIETYPLERAAEAYARMMSGKAEFRVVLTM